jgi:hypothetical protein
LNSKCTGVPDYARFLTDSPSAFLPHRA